MFTNNRGKMVNRSGLVKLNFVNGLVFLALAYAAFGGQFVRADSLDMSAASYTGVSSSGVDPVVYSDGTDTHNAGSEVEAIVSINSATAEEIAGSLFGVGIKKAEAIVEWREVNGEFTSLEELTQVKGIGNKTVERNLSKLEL